MSIRYLLIKFSILVGGLIFNFPIKKSRPKNAEQHSKNNVVRSSTAAREISYFLRRVKHVENKTRYLLEFYDSQSPTQESYDLHSSNFLCMTSENLRCGLKLFDITFK
jgi:hypothetical protein